VNCRKDKRDGPLGGTRAGQHRGRHGTAPVPRTRHRAGCRVPPVRVSDGNAARAHGLRAERRRRCRRRGGGHALVARVVRSLPARRCPRARGRRRDRRRGAAADRHTGLRDRGELRHGRDRDRPARHRHLRRLPARAVRRPRPPLPLSVHQLHELRPAPDDREGRPLRPPHDHDGRIPDVQRVPARVRGPCGPPLPRRADLLPVLRAAAVDAAGAGRRDAGGRGDPRRQGPRRLPPRVRRDERGGGRAATR